MHFVLSFFSFLFFFLRLVIIRIFGFRILCLGLRLASPTQAKPSANVALALSPLAAGDRSTALQWTSVAALHTHAAPTAYYPPIHWGTP